MLLLLYFIVLCQSELVYKFISSFPTYTVTDLTTLYTYYFFVELQLHLQHLNNYLQLLLLLQLLTFYIALQRILHYTTTTTTTSQIHILCLSIQFVVFGYMNLLHLLID